MLVVKLFVCLAFGLASARPSEDRNQEREERQLQQESQIQNRQDNGLSSTLGQGGDLGGYGLGQYGGQGLGQLGGQGLGQFGGQGLGQYSGQGLGQLGGQGLGQYGGQGLAQFGGQGLGHLGRQGLGQLGGQGLGHLGMQNYGQLGLQGLGPQGGFGRPQHLYGQLGENFHYNNGEISHDEEDENTRGGFFEMFTSPRRYFSSLMNDMTDYFSGSETNAESNDENRSQLRYREVNHPLLSNGYRPHGQFYDPTQIQNLLSHGQQFQHQNSIFPPSNLQLQQPFQAQDFGLGQSSGLLPSSLGFNRQLEYANPQHNLLREKRKGHWTGSYSSHYKTTDEEPNDRFIHHVPNTA